MIFGTGIIARNGGKHKLGVVANNLAVITFVIGLLIGFFVILPSFEFGFMAWALFIMCLILSAGLGILVRKTVYRLELARAAKSEGASTQIGAAGTNIPPVKR